MRFSWSLKNPSKSQAKSRCPMLNGSDKANAVSNHLFPPILEQILLLGWESPFLGYGRDSLLGVLIAHDTGYWCRRDWVWQGVMYNSGVWFGMCLSTFFNQNVEILQLQLFGCLMANGPTYKSRRRMKSADLWHIWDVHLFFLEKEPLPKKNHHWEIENSLKVFYLFNGFFMRMFEHEAPPSKNPHLEKAWWKPICWLPHPKGPTVIKTVFPPIEASR